MEVVLKKRLFLISLAIVVKGLVALFFIYNLSNGQITKLYTTSGDTINYFQPLENLITKGQLISTVSDDHSWMRMPCFLPVYLPLRFFFTEEISLNFIILIQIILSGFGVYYLALLAQSIVKKDKKLVFFVAYTTSLISTYSSIFDYYLITESLSTNLTIILLYHLYTNRRSSNKLFWTSLGFVSTWLIFFKPYFIALLIFYFGYLIIETIIKKQAVEWKKVSFFLFPMIVIFGIWTSYNLWAFDEIIVLQKSRGHTTNIESTTNPKIWFMESSRITGNQFTAWDPDGSMFDIENAKNPHINQKFWPDEFFSEVLSRSSFDSLRNAYLNAKFSTNVTERQQIEEEVSEQLRTGVNYYKKNEPIYFHLISRLEALKQFIFQKGAYLIPFPAFQNQSPIQKLIKAFYTILYWIVILFGLTQSIIHCFFKPKLSYYYISAPLAMVIALFPLYLITYEQRFMVIGYSFSIILFSLLAVDILKKIGFKTSNSLQKRTHY